ncbi:MAG: TrkH family potassium uptake protein [Microthrixaceae bacterium]
MSEVPGEQLATAEISRRSRRRRSAEANIAGLALVVCGGALVLSALVGLTESTDDVAPMALWGTSVGLGGLALRHWFDLPERISPRASLRTAAVALVAMIASSSAAYLVTGAIPGLEAAVMESTSGFTTTALTVLTDPEAQSRTVLFWRASSQWIGGFAALATIIAVLPFLGVSGPADAQTRLPTGVSHLTSGHVRRLLARYLGLYALLTVAGAALFLAGGMGPFDAVTYAFTTISTGGFANHGGSFGYFDSALVEWMGVAGMFLGGLSLAVVWSVLRGQTSRIVGAMELRVYCGLILGATAMIAVVQSPGSGLFDNVRISAFSATSAVSSTGHWVADWSEWVPGMQMMLLVLIGVGAMSGSMGGGFRIVRGMALFSYLWRELQVQLQPRLVRVVRVGREVVPEPLLQRVLGYQVLYLGTAAAGFIAMAAAGTDVVTALSGSISALATYGPALGDLGVGHSVTVLGADAVVVAGLLMFAGRIELYPLLDGVVSLVSWPLRKLRALS